MKHRKKKNGKQAVKQDLDWFKFDDWLKTVRPLSTRLEPKKRRSFAVLGLGNFGQHVAEALMRARAEVLAIDRDQERINEMSDMVTQAVIADVTDEKDLKTAGVDAVDTAIVTIGENIEASVLAVMIIKELGVPEVIAKATNLLHAKILDKVGATRVVFPEREAAIDLVGELTAVSVLNYFQLAEGISVVEVPVPPDLVGKTLRETGLRTKYNVNVIAVKHRKLELDREGMGHENSYYDVLVTPDHEVGKDDTLVLVGRDEDLKKLDRLQEG
ncbi:TrkA family potassium uptake protein [candidate division FCPU426 bacterium]|nr:TrkA family potassium uptake protein [candidate division FCPU426 bacterium]